MQKNSEIIIEERIKNKELKEEIQSMKIREILLLKQNK